MLSGCGAPEKNGQQTAAPGSSGGQQSEGSAAQTGDPAVETKKTLAEPVNGYGSVLALGARSNTFVALGDGTVWTAYWEDGGGAGFLTSEDAAAKAYAELVYAFDMSPRKLLAGEWTGFAIDEKGVLWGWGRCVPGKTDSSMPSRLVKIMDGASDVDTEGELSAALKSDGSLWIWGDSDLLRDGVVIPEPEKRMENVTSFGFCGGLFAVNGKGELYRLDTGGGIMKLADNIRSFENGFAYGSDGTLYYIGTNGGFVSTGMKATGASRLGDEKILILDASGDLYILPKGGKAQKTAEGVREIIEAGTVLFIDNEGRLCTVQEGEKHILDSGVLFAASSVDNVLLYIKSDMTLWKIQPIVQKSFLEGKWYEIPPVLLLPENTK